MAPKTYKHQTPIKLMTSNVDLKIFIFANDTNPNRFHFCLCVATSKLQHSGKARKGDGNDLTPNPRKLQCIGRELDKLGRTINQMTSVNESPFKERPKLRKEKNKLASRACRLKKKAQHEANKIKLYGLETEHSESQLYIYLCLTLID